MVALVMIAGLATVAWGNAMHMAGWRRRAAVAAKTTELPEYSRTHAHAGVALMAAGVLAMICGAVSLFGVPVVLFLGVPIFVW